MDHCRKVYSEQSEIPDIGVHDRELTPYWYLMELPYALKLCFTYLFTVHFSPLDSFKLEHRPLRNSKPEKRGQTNHFYELELT